ncbi:MAG: matrixin family metalloprotease [Desulfobulbaceae bacterium]|nr:matrixin family metalloprotease [Pseudomonadota bacterium]MCG2749324.1 matrixin family metalloprotease [Desulfobulbaceae bacterium]
MSKGSSHHFRQWAKNIILFGGLLLLLVFNCASTACAYQLNGSKWPQPFTTFYVDIPGENGLWDSAFEEAMYYWGYYTIFDFYIVLGTYSDPCNSYDSRNGVRFDSTVCGDAWGSTTLAVTHWFYIGATLTQTDIVFNSNEPWSVYSTSWSSWPWFEVNDFQRVAVHELGHALGLGHENSGVSTIMNSYADNDTIPQQDDINGVAALYGPIVLTFPITITKYGTGVGTVTSDPSGINCGTDCSDSYTIGTYVTLTATPSSGSTFAGWTGACTNTSSTCTVTMSGVKSVTATFNLIPAAVSLPNAVDQPLWVITNSGNANWTGQSAATHDGVDAAQSGVIGNSQATLMQTIVSGPGIISFWWSVSSESNYDFLSFFVDGVEQTGRISGDVGWTQQRYTVGSGTHTLAWKYYKDVNQSIGSDAGWVDQIVWPSPIEIYRFYNTVTGTHFYTASYDEMNFVTNTLPQFNYEGAAFCGASDSSASDVSPVYRFYNTVTGTHFYTISEAEKNYVLANFPGFSFEGEAYKAHTTSSPGTKALHRFYNTQTGTHFYTTSDTEKQNVQNTLPQYNYEGIAYYVE